MKEKKLPAIFLLLILLFGITSSVDSINIFADDGNDDREKSKEFEKQKEKAEKAREKAEEQKEKLKEKYKKEIEQLEEKTKQEKEKLKEKLEKELTKSDKKDEKEFEKIKKLEEKTQEKIQRELEKIKEKAEKLEKDDDDAFKTNVDAQLSSVTDSGVTLCHIPPDNPSNAHTITVGLPAAKVHMAAHGDTLGPCGGETNIDLILEEHKAKLAEKLAKLEDKRVKLQEKFIEKAEKLVDKFEEKQTKRTEKLLEKIETGEYFDELIEDEETLREFVLSFDSLTAEPIGKPSETLEFSAKIVFVTSSYTNTRDTMKFKMTDCEIGNDDVSYSCKFGKARTISHGPSDEKNGLVVIATLDDEVSGYPAGLKAFVTASREMYSLEEGHDAVSIILHSPQSQITHQWFLGGEGSLTVTGLVSEDET